MEHADWLEAGYDPAQARFLMLTAITHHRFSSPNWGEDEIRSLHAELAEIDAVGALILTALRAPLRDPPGQPSGIYGLNRRPAPREGMDEQQAS